MKEEGTIAQKAKPSVRLFLLIPPSSFVLHPSEEATVLDAADAVDRRGRTASRTARAFQEVLREVFGVPFVLFDAATGAAIGPAEGVPGRDLEPAAVARLRQAGQPTVGPCEGGAFRLALVLHAGGKPALVAVGSVPPWPRRPAPAPRSRRGCWAGRGTSPSGCG
jgi:hypothetical protein